MKAHCSNIMRLHCNSRVMEMDVNRDRLESAVSLIRSKITIHDVIVSQHVQNPPDKGMIRCLFHDEAIPSFHIDNDLGVFYCFSCGRKGTVIQLIQECENVLHKHSMTYYQTVDYILSIEPDLARQLGFRTVFSTLEERTFRLPRDVHGRIDINFGKKIRPIASKSKNEFAIGSKLNREWMFNTSEDGFSIQSNKIRSFISACELRLPIDIVERSAIAGRLYTESEDIGSVMDVNDEILDDFSIVLGMNLDGCDDVV